MAHSIIGERDCVSYDGVFPPHQHQRFKSCLKYLIVKIPKYFSLYFLESFFNMFKMKKNNILSSVTVASPTQYSLIPVNLLSVGRIVEEKGECEAKSFCSEIFKNFRELGGIFLFVSMCLVLWYFAIFSRMSKII